MHVIDYNSPSVLKAYLEERGLGMQKKFGQNFLINKSAREQLVKILDVHPDTSVWEVGPGLGAETAELLRCGSPVTAFEIDRGFIQSLKEIFGDEQQFRLVEGDVLKTWYPEFQKCVESGTVPSRFFGNLPYNISATLIGNFIEKDVRFDRAVVTVQKEVAQRMTACADSDDYSSFSVLCQWAYTIEPVMDLGPASFWPQPRVASRSVVLVRRDDYPRCKDRRLFMSMQRALFATRRKTIKNNLETFLKARGCATAAAVTASVLSSADIQPLVRAETLPVDVLLSLSDYLADALAAEPDISQKN